MSDQPPSTPAESSPSSRPAGGRAGKQRRSFSINQILAVILLVLVVVFIIENTVEVKIRLIAGPKVQAPVYVAILISAVVGALAAALLSYRRHRRKK